MALIKKTIVVGVIVSIAAVGGFSWWSRLPLTTTEPPIDFTIAPGSGVNAAAQQMAKAGVPINPFLFQVLARLTGDSARIKAGSYELKPNTSPRGLLRQLVRGEFAQEALTIIEGWTFRQMREAIAGAKTLRHDTDKLSDAELMAKVSPDFKQPEGLFFPDTYLFAKGASDLQIYKQAHQMMLARLNAAWEKRAADLPYKTPYEALIMASIVEKETGQKSERGMIAGVFVNRLRTGMMLQTDPSVIYGMGARYEGKIAKKDLLTDTPYNTYTRYGLPPTPISLPGLQSLSAALAPAKTEALYFVSRNDGTSQFSDNLNDHNRAVNQFQRGMAGNASKP
ncbi:endolytic transglycosylase MltG [Massilia sp. Dwa41.01b]|uniref:endolytic transglycosylase MltG n=1 Tax=unclassified Massilia TaxID=2609279 RepID=UPI001601CEB1|nr:MULTISPECIES: endolytic transglycosylase MltG [unclassified Massilia]QNA89041.1 endolytic transglycosylase MltG [Massilia sp. Dwa41.01b]QNA99929.1 endolytic transglycosylase MltG [Massilia sp. Se16.2.3]